MSDKKHVLIICRTMASQMYLGVLMNRIWFTPLLASTTNEGTRLAREKAVSLVLFDGEVPENELFSDIAMLRADPALKELPLVVFITDDDAGKNQMLLAHGCTAVLTKPLDLAIMYGVLARLSGQPRNTPRIPAKMRVQLDGAEGLPEKALACVNLSESGLYLRTLHPLPEGTPLQIKFTLPHDTETIALSADVVRTFTLGSQLDCEPGMGLRFVDIPEEALQKIRNFIQWEVTSDLEWNSNI